MLAGLENALQARKKYVDEAGSVSEASGTGSGRTELNASIAAGASGKKFMILQGGLEKSASGFTGLVNQGATCYLNSLVQTLFMLPEFRAALYEWQYDAAVHGEESRCLSRQLQRLFAQLQLSKRAAVTTGGLTKSFGWSGSEAFVQQDVQECMSVIFAHLQDQSIGEHVASKHEGELYDYLQCSDCLQYRGRMEKFRDLQLVVKDMTTLEGALQAFVTAEELDGVECTHGKFMHKKGEALLAVPDVLTLQLKRFELNMYTMQRVKLNDKIAIPERLDMGPYLWTKRTDGTVKPDETPAGGPFEYELLAVLMHTGGAMSGHYFAYIKDVAADRWLNFNDSSVTEIEHGQIQSILGTAPALGADPATASGTAPEAAAADSSPIDGSGGGASKPVMDSPAKPASSNAYMLVYRRINAANVNSVDPSTIPEEVLADIAEENATFDKIKAEWEEERKWINWSVYFQGPAKALKIHENDAIADATTKAQALFPDLGQLPQDRIRLRWYDALKNTLLAPLPEGKCLKELPDEMLRKPVKIEVREADQEFEEYLPNGVPLSALVMHRDRDEFGEPLPLCVEPAVTVGQLRALLHKKCGVPLNSLSVVWFPGDNPVQLDNDDMALLSDYKINPGDTLHVEERLAGAPSRLGPYFEGLVNMISISFNDARTAQAIQDCAQKAAAGAAEEGGPAATDVAVGDTVVPASVVDVVKQMHDADLALNGERQEVRIDQRAPLTELKTMIASRLGLEVDSFKLRRSAAGQELKDLNLSILLSGLEDGSQVHVKLGKPMVPGEWTFLVKLMPKPDGEALSCGPFVLHESMTIAEAKAAIHAAFGESHGAPPPNCMRLRMCQGTGLPGKVKLGQVLVDDNTLLEQYGAKLTDGKQLGVQPTAGPETFSSEHMLVRVQQWHPVAKVLDGIEEVAVLRTASIVELLDQLAVGLARGQASGEEKAGEEAVSASGKDLALVKPFSYLLKDVTNIPTLKWIIEPRPETKLGTAPLRLQDGDLLVYKDNRQPEDITPEMADRMAQNFASSQAVEEVGFKIFSPAEQLAREEERKKEAAQQKKDDEERVRSLMANLKSRDGVEPPLPPAAGPST